MVGTVRHQILPDRHLPTNITSTTFTPMVYSTFSMGPSTISSGPETTASILDYSPGSTTVMPEGDWRQSIDAVAVVTALAFYVGCVQLLMGILRLDFLASYLSDQVITAFTTAAAFHVFTAQLNDVFGVKLERLSGPFSIFLVSEGVLPWLFSHLRQLFVFKNSFRITTIWPKRSIRSTGPQCCCQRLLLLCY